MIVEIWASAKWHFEKNVMLSHLTLWENVCAIVKLTKETENKLKRMTAKPVRLQYEVTALSQNENLQYKASVCTPKTRFEGLEKCFGSGYSIMKHNTDPKGKRIHSPSIEATPPHAFLIAVSHYAMLQC